MTCVKQSWAWSRRPRCLRHSPFSIWTMHWSSTWYSDGSGRGRKKKKKTLLFCIRRGLMDQKSALVFLTSDHFFPLETPTPSHRLDLEHCEGKRTWVILQLLLCFLDSDQNALCQFRPFANNGEAIPNIYHFLS